MGTDRLRRVRRRRLAAPDAGCRRVLQPGRRGAGTALRRRRLAIAARDAARRRARRARPEWAGERVRGVATRDARRRLTRAGDGRSGRRIGLRAVLQSPRHSDRRVGIRRRGRRVPLAVRRLHLDDEVRRSRLRVSRRAARIAAAMVLRIANADVLPYDYVEFARTMRRYLPAIDRAVAQRRWNDTSPTAPLARAIDRMEERRRGSRARATRRWRQGRAGKDALAETNRALTAGRARAHAAGRAAHAPLVPQPDLRRRREQRLREHGASLGQRSDPEWRRGAREREIADLAQRFDDATHALADARRAISVASSNGQQERRPPR